MQLDFEGRDVVVTGGAGALGAAVVELLLDCGAVCHLPVRSAPEPGTLPWADHERVRITPGVDLAQEQPLQAFYRALPGLWASIHCAGGYAAGPIAELTQGALQRLIDMNLVSCTLCCREAVTAIRRTGMQTGAPRGGRIVNVAAMPALEPRRGAGSVAYTITKAGIAALTEALAEEVAGEEILVNAVAPSLIDTAVNRAAIPGADYSRWAKPKEIAETIVFLAAPANRVGRGGILPVYGRT